MSCAWRALRAKNDAVDHANRSPKRPVSTPARADSLQMQPHESFSGHSYSAVALLPDVGAVPEDNRAMRPLLVRGTGPRKPRRPCGKSEWPHDTSLQLAQVPLTYPATRRTQRMLMELSRPSTAAWSRPVSSTMSLGMPGTESGIAGEGSHAGASASPRLLLRATSEKRLFPRHWRGGPLSGDCQALPDRSEGDSRFDMESSKLTGLSIDCSSASREASPSCETSRLGIEPWASTSFSVCVESDVCDAGPSTTSYQRSSLPGSNFRSEFNRSSLADSSLEAATQHRPSTTPVRWLSSFISKAPSFAELPQRPSKSSMSPPLPRVTSEPNFPGKKLKGKVCQAALIGAHSELRRLGNPYLQQLALEAATPPPKVGCRTGCMCCPHLEALRPRVPQAKDAERSSVDEMAYMEKVVSSCSDTPESLRDDIAALYASHDPIQDELGGARHPTTLVFARALKITERKLVVLSALVEATRQFEAMSARKPEVIRAVINGQSAEEAAGAALGYEDKVKNSIHAKPYGCPEDGDKSFFDFFVSTMKLSKNHVSVLHAQSILKAETEPWVQALAKSSREEFDKECASGDETANSPSAEAIRRLFTLSAGLSLPEEHPKLIETEMLGNAAKARKVKINAQAEWRGMEDCKQPSKAREAALRVEIVVKDAIKWGLEKNHPDMRTALSLSHDLHGRSVLLAAEDEFRLMKSRNKVGDAEAAAVRIEDSIKDCISMGVPVSHGELEAARKIALKFREEEGIRRRQANRDKQLAQKAAEG